MCERALQDKEAKVNILLDFLLNLTTMTALYLGHKPTNVMIDSRTKPQFDKIKANKDNRTLKFHIFNTQPLLQMKLLTSVLTWRPSVHLIRNMILFASADYRVIQKKALIEPINSTPDQFDVNKKVKIDSKRNKSDDKVSGEFISLMLCSSKPPFRTILTILTKMDDCE